MKQKLIYGLSLIATAIVSGTTGHFASETYLFAKLHDTGVYTQEYQYAKDFKENTGWHTGSTPDSQLASTGKKVCTILDRDKPADYRKYITEMVDGSEKMANTMDVVFHTAVPIFCPDQLDTINQKG